MSSAFSQEKIYNIAGVKKLFIIETAYINALTIVDNKVTGISTMDDEPFRKYEVKNISYNLGIDKSKAGFLYTPEISFNIAKLDTAKSLILTTLLNLDTSVVLEDRNGVFWLIGLNQGLDSTYSASIDNDTNSFTVKMKGRQLKAPIEVTKACTVALGFEPVIVVAPPAPDENIVTVSYDGYMIQNEDDVILMTLAGGRIFLPEAAEHDQTHVIKVTFSGGTSPVIVDGNGFDINGSPEYEITDAYPVIRLRFKTG